MRYTGRIRMGYLKSIDEIGIHFKGCLTVTLIIFLILSLLAVGDESAAESAATWNANGISLYGQGKYVEALQAFNNALEFDPLSAQIWYNKGNSLYSQANYDEAINAYDKVVELDPQYASAWFAKGKALRYLDRFEEAIKAFDNAIECDPNFAEAWYNKGFVLNLLGKDDEARLALSRSEELGYTDSVNGDNSTEMDQTRNQLGTRGSNAPKPKVLSGYTARDFSVPLNPYAQTNDAEWAIRGSGRVGRPSYPNG